VAQEERGHRKEGEPGREERGGKEDDDQAVVAQAVRVPSRRVNDNLRQY
jgi:hypothetical protein